MPTLNASWDNLFRNLKTAIENANNGGSIETTAIDRWVKFAKVIADNEPRFLKQIDFPNGFKEEIAQLLIIAENYLHSCGTELDGGTLSDEAEVLESLSNSLEGLADIVPGQEKKLIQLVKRLDSKAVDMRDDIARIEQEDPDQDIESISQPSAQFDIARLFADL